MESADSERRTRRGRYDRGLSLAERDTLARARWVDAVVEAAGVSTVRPTVAQMCAIAGMGRNAFYLHFQDVEEALQGATQEMGIRLSEVLQAGAQARTPIERLRGLAHSWHSFVFESVLRARFCLRVEDGEAQSVAGRVLLEELRGLVEESVGRGLVAPSATARLVPAAGAVETLARAAAMGLEEQDGLAQRCADTLVRTLW